MEKHCLHCGGLFIALIGLRNKKYCSLRCKDAARDIRRKIVRKEYHRQWYHKRKQRQGDPKTDSISAITQCLWCESEFMPLRNCTKRFCSRRCGRYYSSHVWKMRKKSGTPDKFCIEPFTRWEIFRRDKFICQICGEKVDLAVDSTNCNYPTIDHIVPISKGGQHTRANVQCAHLFCNSLKNDDDIPSMFFAINKMVGGGHFPPSKLSLTGRRPPHARPQNLKRDCSDIFCHLM